MENSYQFFNNKDCKFYPCHEGIDPDDINCMFCYCPLYSFEACPGAYQILEVKGKAVKDCSGCTWNHNAENYWKIISILSKAGK